jgi:hypothetical protein
MSTTEVNTALCNCLRLVVTTIQGKLGSSCEWDFDLNGIKGGVRFTFKRYTAPGVTSTILTCSCATKLWHEKGTKGRSLRSVDRVKESLGCSFVEKYICELWTGFCNADAFFKDHGFEFSVEGSTLEAHLSAVPQDLAISCQNAEIKPTLFRKFLLAKNISEKAPAAGDDNLTLEDGTHSISLLDTLIQRCYTSATFYKRFWAGDEQFAGDDRTGVFVFAHLVSLVVERKLKGRSDFEMLLDFVDQCAPGQVGYEEFIAKADVGDGGGDGGIDGDGTWVPDLFLEPQQEERRQFLIAKVQLAQDKMKQVPYMV